MSETRRLKRARLREKSTIKVDWTAIKKNGTLLVLACTALFVVVFLFSIWVIQSHNTIRETVAKHAATVQGRVISLSSRGSVIATYEFTVNGKTYTGKTFNVYDGEIGNHICINYSKQNPQINHYCEDEKIETLFDDGILPSLGAAAIALVLCAILIGVQIILKK